MSEHTKRGKQKAPIPEFQSYEEEAAFWNTHDFSEFWDEAKPVEAHVAEHLSEYSLSKKVEVRFDEETDQELTTQANERGVKKSTLRFSPIKTARHRMRKSDRQARERRLSIQIQNRDHHSGNRRKNALYQIPLLVLSLLGAGIAIYLTAVHYENVPLICSTRGLVDCSRVLSSAYSVIPGTTVPISVPGLLWCVVSAGLAIMGLRALQLQVRRRIQVAQFAWSLLGMLTVIYLVYVELVLLHTICAWCTALHAIILVVFLTAVVQLQLPEDEPEVVTEEAIPHRAGTH